MKKITQIITLAVLLLTMSGAWLFSGETKPDESWKNRKITTEEIKKYNGENGSPVYVAVDGIIYDVSGSKYWKTGKHMKMHQAGADLTDAIKNKAPQKIHMGGKILEKMPKVGILVMPELKPLALEAEKALEPDLKDEKTKKMGEFFQTGQAGKKEFFDEPLFVYFGAAALFSLAVTLFIGFNMSKFGFKKHKFFALLTLTLALAHFFLRYAE